MKPALQEQDVLFAAVPLLQGAIDGLDDHPARADGGCRTDEFERHRVAVQHRNGRLRTIEALRRPGK